MAPNELSSALSSSGRPDVAEDAELHDLEMDGCSLDEEGPLQSADSQDETDTEALALQRTSTQLQKQTQINEIQSRAGNLQDTVQQLKSAVECFAKEDINGADDAEAVQKFKTVLDDKRKCARNLGEDLTQDLLSLDKLSGLVPEDRACRKVAIAMIEALLDDVDATKSMLGSIDSKIAALQRRIAAAPPLATRSESCGHAERAGRQVPVRPHNARTPDASCLDMASRFENATKPPSAEVWAGLQLPLRLHTREEEGHYIITVPARDLDPEEVDLKIDVDETTMTIGVLRLPHAAEAAQMRNRVVAHLQQLAARSAGQRDKVLDSLEDLARRSYISLGQGAFGRFEKSVQVPEDADVAAIRSTCSGDALRVVLPKRPRQRSGQRAYLGRRFTGPATYSAALGSFGGFPF